MYLIQTLIRISNELVTKISHFEIDMKSLGKILLIFGVFILTISASAQTITIKGKVTDAVTNEAITYATIAVKGTSIGTNSNFDGLYKLAIVNKTDSLTVSCVGYRTRSFLVTSPPEQTINIRL